MSNNKTLTFEGLIDKESRLVSEISDLKKALELIPSDSALATLSLKATIKYKTNKLFELREEISKRVTI